MSAGRFPIAKAVRVYVMRGKLAMTNLLIKKFVKNYEQVENADVRAAYGILGSAVGIICNLLLSVLKLIVGTAAGSTAVVADGFNNLSDMTSSAISLLSARASSRPSDREHPFGHGRIEYVTALIISIAVIDVGINLFKESVGKIQHPEPMRLSIPAFLLLLASVGVKLWMSFFNRSLGNRIQSGVLRATAVDSLIDAVTTAVTIASLLVYVLADINIDGVASLLVSLLIIWAGIGIARDTFSPLIGQEMDPDTEKKIVQIIEEEPSVISTHDLIIHSYGPSSSMATIHIEVPSRMTLEEAHAVADKAEKNVLQKLGILLVVHVDPVDMDDARTVRIREQITRILRILDKNLSFHDLQTEFTDKETLIRFDLVVPYKYKPEDEDRVTYQVSAFMRELNPQNHCDITIDRGAVEDVRYAAENRQSE